MNENFLVLLGLGNTAKAEGKSLVGQIDAVLPQTQCTQCDFDGCKPYAEAIAAGEAEINQCPPGGQDGINALAELLGRETLPLNKAHGETKPRRINIDRQEAKNTKRPRGNGTFIMTILTYSLKNSVKQFKRSFRMRSCIFNINDV